MRVAGAARLAAATATLGATLAVAQSHRPLATEPAEVLGHGVYLLELGAAVVGDPPRTVDGPNQGTLVQAPILGFQIGLGPFAELRMEGAAWQRIDDDDEVRTDTGDLKLWTKLRFRAAGARTPAVGWRFGVKLPNAGKPSLGLNTTDFFAEALVTQPLGRRAELDANVGLAILDDPESSQRQDDALAYGLALRVPLGERLGIGAEMHGQEVRREEGTSRVGLWYTKRRWGWDVGVSRGFSGVAPDWSVAFGVHWRPRPLAGASPRQGTP